MKSLTPDNAVRRATAINCIASSTCHSVYVGTHYGVRVLIHRMHDLSGCDHVVIGRVDREAEAALASAGVEIR